MMEQVEKKEHRKKTLLLMYVPVEMKEEVEKRAEESGLFTSAMIQLIIDDFFRRGGKILL